MTIKKEDLFRPKTRNCGLCTPLSINNVYQYNIYMLKMYFPLGLFFNLKQDYKTKKMCQFPIFAFELQKELLCITSYEGYTLVCVRIYF